MHLHPLNLLLTGVQTSWPLSSLSCLIHIQCCNHQYGWSGFNWTMFWGNNHISANIHEFGGMPGRPVGSHMATVDRARDRWLQIVWKQCFLVFLMSPIIPHRCHKSPSCKLKNEGEKFCHTMHLYAAAIGSGTPLLQTSSTTSANGALQISWLWPCYMPVIVHRLTMVLEFDHQNVPVHLPLQN